MSWLPPRTRERGRGEEQLCNLLKKLVVARTLSLSPSLFLFPARTRGNKSLLGGGEGEGGHHRSCHGWVSPDNEGGNGRQVPPG